MEQLLLHVHLFYTCKYLKGLNKISTIASVLVPKTKSRLSAVCYIPADSAEIKVNVNFDRCIYKKIEKQERIEPIQFIVHVTAFKADALR